LITDPEELAYVLEGYEEHLKVMKAREEEKRKRRLEEKLEDANDRKMGEFWNE